MALSLLSLLSLAFTVQAKQNYKELAALVEQGDINQLTYLLNRDQALTESMQQRLAIRAEKKTEQLLKSSHCYGYLLAPLKFIGGSLLAYDTYTDLNVKNSLFAEVSQKKAEKVVRPDNAERVPAVLPVMMKFLAAYSGYFTLKQGLSRITMKRVARAQAVEALIKKTVVSHK